MLADAGVHRAIFDLMTTDSISSWPNGGRLDHAFELSGNHARVQIRDEDGKIDLNLAPPAFLRGLFQAAGLDDEKARILAAQVIDYRDEDGDPEPSGAEDEAYFAAGRSDGAADRPFRHIGELADVLGVTGGIFDRVRHHVTIYSGVEGVDVFRASGIVLKALPGMTSETEAAILSNADAEDPLLDLPDTLIEPLADYLLPSRELIFEVRSLGESAEGGRFLREAVIALDGGRDALPFTIYEWRRGRFPLNE
jgi:general secretion pathway protein K